MSTASDVAKLTASYFSLLARVIALEQRVARDEAKIQVLQAELARVKKG